MLLVAINSAATARETYVAFATRIVAAPPEGAAIRDDMEQAIFTATNAFRAGKGLHRLKPASEKLRLAARAHAVDLLMAGGMGHTASTGHDFSARMRAFHEGQMVLAAMAENAARLRNSKLNDAAKAQALLQQWIDSGGHRRNMSNRSFTSMAVGVVTRGNITYAVQIFSGPEVKSNILGNSKLTQP